MENSELLERFLPGYRLVCRLFARYLGIDLTDFMTKAFVVFALLKSAQYLWTALSGILIMCVTSSVEVSERSDVFADVMGWVSGNVLENGGGVARRKLWVARRKLWVARGGGEEEEAAKVNGMKKSGKAAAPLRYEPAYDSPIWFFHGWHIMFLRRQKTALHGETILLTCIGLTTDPLRYFLEECTERAAHKRAGKGHGKD